MKVYVSCEGEYFCYKGFIDEPNNYYFFKNPVEVPREVFKRYIRAKERFEKAYEELDEFLL